MIGLVLTSIAALAVRTLLYDVGSNDPIFLAATVAFLGTIALIAAYIPACRAAAVVPVSRLDAD